MSVSRANLVKAGFGLALIVVAGVSLVSYQSLLDLLEAQRWQNHALEVIALLEDYLNDLTDAETARRGYTITGREEHLLPYVQALERNGAKLDTLRRRTADNPTQQRRLDILAPLVVRRLEQIQRAIEIKKRDPNDAHRQAVLTEEGKELHEAIRQLLAEIRDEEHRLLEERALQAGAKTRAATLFGVLGSLLALTLVGLAGAHLTVELHARTRAERELQSYAAEITDLYHKAPCAYHSLDADGRFLRINQTELNWIGYQQQEILGKPFTELLTPDGLATFQANYPVMKERGGIRNIEVRLIRRDGSSFPVLINATVVKDAAGQFVMTRSTMIDITERKKLEEALRRAHDDLEQRVHERTVQLANANAVIQAEVLEHRRTTAALQASEQRARLQLAELDHLYQTAPVGLCIQDRDLRFVRINERLAAINGKSVAEHLGHTPREVIPEIAPTVDPICRQVLATGQPVLNREIHGSTPAEPGVARDFLASYFPLAGPDGAWQRVGTVVLDITERKRAEKQVHDQALHLRELSRQLLKAQEVERRRIARELHDEIGQVLTAVKINLQSLQRSADPATPLPRLQESFGIVEHALQQVRNLSLDLRPSLLDDLGLVAALRWYLDRQAGRAGFHAHFQAEPAEMRLPPELATACFRIVQEAVTNIIRHARARSVSVEARLDDRELMLTVRDDGAGFDVAGAQQRAARGGSLGLAGMHERAALLGGQMEVESAPARGTVVRVRFPLLPEAGDAGPLERSTSL